jgi:hypothetical protein
MENFLAFASLLYVQSDVRNVNSRTLWGLLITSKKCVLAGGRKLVFHLTHSSDELRET